MTPRLFTDRCYTIKHSHVLDDLSAACSLICAVKVVSYLNNQLCVCACSCSCQEKAILQHSTVALYAGVYIYDKCGQVGCQ